MQIHNNTPAVPNVIVAIKDSYNQGTQGFPSARKPFEANAQTRQIPPFNHYNSGESMAWETWDRNEKG